ncbi:unnamed protein product, partial [marine sediment metagenome]
MAVAATVVLGLLFFLGWCAGTREQPKSCDCQRCWYVNEPPEGTPMCKVVKTIAIAG